MSKTDEMGDLSVFLPLTYRIRLAGRENENLIPFDRFKNNRNEKEKGDRFGLLFIRLIKLKLRSSRCRTPFL